jgi:hypothetical protein
MDLSNRSYKNLQTGEIINISESYQNVAISDRREKYDVRNLLDERYYVEWVNPDNFFKSESTYNVFAEKIKSIDLDKIPNDIVESNNPYGNSPYSPTYNNPYGQEFQPATNESTVLPYDPEEEKMELMRKYGAVGDITPSLESQNQKFEQILNPTPQVSDYVQPDNIEPILHYTPPQEDPIILMFKGAKRGVDLSLDISIDSKIPRIDFIEMMEDTYETSIIEYLADEITDNLLRNPYLIRQSIIDKIKEMVYPNKSVDEVSPEEVPVVKKSTRGRKIKKVNQSVDIDVEKNDEEL